MFTAEDHAQLELAMDLMHWAAEVINGVMERRRKDLTMQAISFLSEAKRDADLGEREVRMADKYLNYKQGEVA